MSLLNIINANFKNKLVIRDLMNDLWIAPLKSFEQYMEAMVVIAYRRRVIRHTIHKIMLFIHLNQLSIT